MTDEKSFIQSYLPITDENFLSLLQIFQSRYSFITDEQDLGPGEEPICVFLVPLSQYDFRYATMDEYLYWRTTEDHPFKVQGIALPLHQYFDFLLGKIRFTEDLNGVEGNVDVGTGEAAEK